MKKFKINISSGVIIMVVGSLIGKSTYLVRIGNIGITLSNFIITLGIFIVTYNTILIIKDKNENNRIMMD